MIVLYPHIVATAPTPSCMMIGGGRRFHRNRPAKPAYNPKMTHFPNAIINRKFPLPTTNYQLISIALEEADSGKEDDGCANEVEYGE